MKSKKKLKPWEWEPWEERRREAIKEQKIIITSTQKHHKPVLAPIYTGRMHVTFLDFATTHYGTVTNAKPERNGVKFKQMLMNPYGHNDKGYSQGSWRWLHRTIMYWPGKYLEFCTYHELGHFYNGDQGMFSSTGNVVHRERRAWLAACLMIKEEDIDEFVQDANRCMRTYDEGIKPIIREEVIERRKFHLCTNGCVAPGR